MRDRIFQPFPDTDIECFIQWKGTDVCVDLHCECGKHLHYDGRFLYHWKCWNCGQIYTMGTQVAIYKATPEEVEGRVVQEIERRWDEYIDD